MSIYLVRHTKAGDRSSWPGDDFLRPLSRRGQIQAEGLLEQLADQPVDRILSSSYVRCLESVAPLAAQRMIPIEPVEALTEGASLQDAVTLVGKHTHHDAVMCSHGDIIPMLLDHFAARGVDLGPDPTCPKGSTWVLDVDGAGEVAAARYLPPPADRRRRSDARRTG